MSDNLLTIGVDHGYAAMKTKNFSFPTGLVEYEYEPYTQKMYWNLAANITLSEAAASLSRRTKPWQKTTTY